MDTLDLVRDWMDRFERKIDGIVDDVGEIKIEVNDVKNDVTNLRKELKDHMKEEMGITKKVGGIVVAAIAIVGAIGFGSVIVFAPKVIAALAALL